MKGDIERRLEWGIQAAQAGEQWRAREILIHVIELDQYNEDAWWWLGSVVETTAEKIVCMENVLVINPDNYQAAANLQRLRQQPVDFMATRSLLPRLAAPPPPIRGRRGASAADSAPTPAQQICPRCGYRNPGWAYLCDRCGADLQPVDVHGALRTAAKSRGRSSTTLLEAWGGAFTFNRLLAFQPEIELASWGRSLAALGMGALFASAWQAITGIVRPLLAGGYFPMMMRTNRLTDSALLCTAQTPILALLLALVWAPTASLTWLGARLVGGRQGFKTHAHLAAVALSACVVLGALLGSIFTFMPDLLSDYNHLSLVAGVVGIAGTIWLTQAIQTAHDLPAVRAIPVTLLVVVLGVALLFGLALRAGEQISELVDRLVSLFPP